jgi:hypothetical protein
MKEERKIVVEFVEKDIIHNDNLVEIFVRKIREYGFDDKQDTA